MQKNAIISTIISLALIGGTLYLVSDRPASISSTDGVRTQNTEIKDGVQYVTILAKGGYAPKISEIKPDIPTKLIVKTDDTYDCSAALIIRTLGFRKMLRPKGEEIIDLGIPQSGEKLQGVCGMGMYSFQIKVK